MSDLQSGAVPYPATARYYRASRAAAVRLNLARRSWGEELWLWRLRHLSPSGRTLSAIGSAMSQIEAAKKLGINARKYHDAEADQLPERDIECLVPLKLPVPTAGELCRLARRRSGLTLEKISKEVGASRVTYLRREYAGEPAVIAYWQSKGFVFG